MRSLVFLLTLLRQVSLREWRLHPVRQGLAIVAVALGVTERDIRAEGTDRRAEHRLEPAHLDQVVGLEVGPQGQVVADPAAVEA